MQTRISSVDELAAYAHSVSLESTSHMLARVLCLSGELGAGKTTFTQHLAREFGIEETVTSPTFVIEKIYSIPHHPLFSTLVHIDAYRIKALREIEVLGWHELLNDKRAIVVIEWAENIRDLIPEHAQWLRFDIEGEERIITDTHGKKSNEKDSS
jgi:tRNA threonylcarbamoyl adenosine modification protein YjeE